MTRPRFGSWILYSLLAVLLSWPLYRHHTNEKNLLGISSQFLSVPNTHYKSCLARANAHMRISVKGSNWNLKCFSSIPFGTTTPSVVSHASQTCLVTKLSHLRNCTQQTIEWATSPRNCNLLKGQAYPPPSADRFKPMSLMWRSPHNMLIRTKCTNHTSDATIMHF